MSCILVLHNHSQSGLPVYLPSLPRRFFFLFMRGKTLTQDKGRGMESTGEPIHYEGTGLRGSQQASAPHNIKEVPRGKHSGWELRPRRPVGSSGIHYCRQRHGVPRLTESGPERAKRRGEQSVPSVTADDVRGSTLAWILPVARAPCYMAVRGSSSSVDPADG